MESNHNHINVLYRDLQIWDCSHNVIDSLSFRTINEMNLSEKHNLIRLAGEGVTYFDLSNQFVVSIMIAEKIV